MLSGCGEGKGAGMLVPRMLETAPPRPALEPPGRDRRTGRRGLAILVSVLLLAILAGAGVRYYSWCRGASGPRTPVRFVIPDGASGAEVVDALHARGVIRCGLVSKYLLNTSGLSDSIRAGTFDLTTNMTPDDAFSAIAKSPPPIPTVRLTIPEGYRLTQIAERVQEALGIPPDRFLSLAESGTYSLPPYLPRGTPTTEGFLFPKTYKFVPGETTAGDVIERLLHQFDEEVAGLPWGRAKALGLTPYEVVIVASMIEREVRLDRERPLVAAVIYNRLRLGMALGIDATLQYVDPNPEDGLTDADLRMDSPYNTRLHAGLPPTPIASPRLDSIAAALSPARVDYLYYVLCGDDGHHEFTASSEEFVADKRRCLG